MREQRIKQLIKEEKDSLDALEKGVAQQTEIAELMARLALLEKRFHLQARSASRKQRGTIAS